MSERSISLAAGVLPECAPIDVARAAEAAGYRHCGFTIPSDDFGESDLAELVRFTSDAGLSVLDVEVLWLDPGAEVTDVHRRKLDAGIALGAANALVVSSEADHGRIADAMNTLCEHVGESPMRVALEFLMITEVRSLAAASAIVAKCGHPKAGVLIDTLHLQRANEGSDDVASFVAAAPSRLPYMQLCDGLLSVDDYLVDALDLRSAAGEGELPLVAVMAAVPDDLPLSLEVRSKRYRDDYPDPIVRARAVLQQTERFLNQP